ncbi:hypothetical protein GWK48_05985 [Metallosphaera tengchongensis]|uniref:Uncharacterized protein n=1 Tax=Metallosphaera tengchongensis TaxID=1532350 RepID=A0A6N0NY09_9CREN|nr:hypothetical protein [Metallosphaera tengchongensis]QKQ99989.1 hypothetical protein GWK48_05985 [Metallosphaera tengchongensis]
MDSEDKLLIIRGVLGGIAGVLSSQVPTFYVSVLVVVSAYLISLAIGFLFFRGNKTRTVLTKGIITLVVAWFLILIVTYNL